MIVVSLSEICDLQNGFAFKSSDYVSHSNTLNCRMSNIRPDGKFDVEYAPKYLPDEFTKTYSNFLLKDGDIVIAMTDMANDPKILGVPTIVDTKGKKMLLNQRVGKLILLNENQIDIAYLQHSLNRTSVKKYYTQFAGGGLQLNVGKKEILSVKIPLPPLEQQKKIASILDAADAYRQLTKALIAKYDELTQSLFLDMFGDPVKNEKGWEEKTIEKLVKENNSSIKRGPFGGALKKEIFVEDGYLVYEQFHALNNDFSMARYFIDENKFQELKGFEVKPKDIIISCSGVYLGKLAIIPENARKGIINQALLKITLNEEKMKNNFFVFLFSHKNFREKYFDANRGAGIPNFPPMSEFKKFPFITPPISLQTQFAERVQVIEIQKAQAQASLVKAEELFNSLLHKAFKGELV
jgi:type I restriction enzyme S subunit